MVRRMWGRARAAAAAVARVGREGGFSTAELLGNAVLGIAAVVAIWQGLRLLGLDIVAWIRAQLGIP